MIARIDQRLGRSFNPLVLFFDAHPCHVHREWPLVFFTAAARGPDCGLESGPVCAYVTCNLDLMESTKMATNPLQYVQQVRSEVAKVVWPTRREVMLTTVMVFIMAALTAVFFAIIDIIIRTGLTSVLGFFGS